MNTIAQPKYEQIDLRKNLGLLIQTEIVNLIQNSHNLKMIKDVIEGTPDRPSAADVFDRLTVAQMFKAGLSQDLNVFLQLQEYHQRVPQLIELLKVGLAEKHGDGDAWYYVVTSIIAQGKDKTDKPTEWTIPCLSELVDNQAALAWLNHLRSREFNKRVHNLAKNLATNDTQQRVGQTVEKV